MKKILFLIFITLIFTGCYEKGEIANTPHDFIQIHGKVYKLMSIAPCTGCSVIWILYPKDSLDRMPTSLNYIVNSGKTAKRESVIIIE